MSCQPDFSSGQPDAAASPSSTPADLICAGDVFYEKPMAEAVLAWLQQAVANGTRVIVGDPSRTYFPRSGLTLLAEYTVPTTRELKDQEDKRSRGWSLDPGA
ncbi:MULTISPECIES: class I SAM-dependent methyltransferase [unclassified Brevundimonas]|uniref:class I SAM-dependent methyltransferase n=1 Tax=unclassified Brevundimonas TaxID=2622653 RepID=UPI003F91FD69